MNDVKPDPAAGPGADRVADALWAHGVRSVFTLSGSHISPILGAARSRGIRIVDVRNEATAVFAADATARLGGLPGVAAVTPGPGVANTLTALKNAQLAQSPVILLGGAAPTALQGRGALQDIDHRALVGPHVKLFRKVTRVRDLGAAVEEAFMVARSGVPGPVFVECPADLLYDQAAVRQWYADATGNGRGVGDRAWRFYLNRHVRQLFEGSADPVVRRMLAVKVPRAAAGAIRSAQTALARSRRPLLVVGSQAVVLASQAPALARAIERLGVPVYLSGMARGLLGREHSLLLRHGRRQALREADCVLLAGVPCDFRLDYGRQLGPGAVLIAANRSARNARLNRKPDIAAIGDAGLMLQEVAQAAPPSAACWRDWLAQLRRRDDAREAEIDSEASRGGEFVNTIAFLRALERAAGDNALLVADGGNFVASARGLLHPRGPLSWLDAGAFGTRGVGAGFALAAALARPASQVWLILGEGAAGAALAEFDSFVRHGIPLIAVVGNDTGGSELSREQAGMVHDEAATVRARRADCHLVAAAWGGEGILVRQMSEAAPALARARELAAQGKPVLVNVWLDKSGIREHSPLM